MKTMKSERKVIIGARSVIKAMERGEVERVLIASNAPDWIKEKVIESAKKAKVKVEIFKGNELRLGIKVGRPFPIACVGFRK